MEVGSVDPETLARDLALVQLVDVRYPNEWEAGHVEGAVHIPLDDIFDRLGELDPARRVIAMCRSGGRSAEAAKDLAGEGFDVGDLRGGVAAWAAKGLPLVSGAGTPGAVVEPQPPPDDRPPEMQQLQADFLGAIFAVKEHFGDREPSEDEVLAFLRQRSIDEGETPADVDARLARMSTDRAATQLTATHPAPSKEH